MFQIKHLSYSYKLNNKKEVNIFNDLNFSLPNKGLVFITGKSGCGKTTLLNILEGLLKPNEGEVLFNNKDIYKEKKFNFNAYYGILFQNYNLLDNLTVYENLKIVCDLKNIDYLEIDKRLEEFKMSQFKDQEITNLSGGEKQRIAFIRAIISKPKIVFCDEPTGALDTLNSTLLLENLRELSKESLVIIVTHNTSLIKENDYILKLNKGKIIVNNLEKVEENIVQNTINLKPQKHKGFINLLSKRLLKKSSFKYFLFILSTFFTFLFLELTISLSLGLKSQKENLEFSYLNYNKFQISEREKKVETNSPLTLIKEVRPNLTLIKEEFKDLLNTNIYNNYTYFLSGQNQIFSGPQELKNIKIDLAYNLNSGVIINNSLYDLLQDKKAKISIELNQTYEYKINDDFDNFKIFNERFYYSKFINKYEIINEFKYLNVPTIYLSFNEFESYLKQNYLNNAYVLGNKKINWFNAVSEAKNDDPITSFSYNFYLDDKKKCLDCFRLIDNLKDDEVFKIINEPHFYVKSFLDISNILNVGLIVFTILSCIVTFSLLFFINISVYLEQKKDISVLKILGTKDKEINQIFENLTEQETLCSFAFSILLFLLSGRLINKFIYNKMAINNLLLMPNSKENLIIILLFFIIFFFSIFVLNMVNKISLLRFKKSSIAKDLREE